MKPLSRTRGAATSTSARAPHIVEFGPTFHSVTMGGAMMEFKAGIPYRPFVGESRRAATVTSGSRGDEPARITPDGIVTCFSAEIYPSRGNDSRIDSAPSIDGSGRICFNEPQGGRIACATTGIAKVRSFSNARNARNNTRESVRR